MLADYILLSGEIQNMVFDNFKFNMSLFSLMCLLHFPNVFSNCELSKNPDKLVIAGGSLTEIVYELEEEKKLLAVDITSNFPKAAKELPSVGYVRALSTEGLLSLTPSLILGEQDMGPPLVLDQLELVGVDIRLIKDNFSSAGILSRVLCVSEIIGAEKATTSNVLKSLKLNIDQLERNIFLNNNQSKKILLILSFQGTSPIVAGKETSGHGFIRLLGAKNVMEDVRGWKPVSSEEILGKNPDYIFITKRGMSSFKNEESLGSHPSIKFTNAAKLNNVFSVDGMSMLGFGPRTIQTALEVSNKFLKK